MDVYGSFCYLKTFLLKNGLNVGLLEKRLFIFNGRQQLQMNNKKYNLSIRIFIVLGGKMSS